MKISVEEITKVADLHKKFISVHADTSDGPVTMKQLLSQIRDDDYIKAKDSLINYMEQLDYEKILELETLMEFGREWYCHMPYNYPRNELDTEPFSVDILDCFNRFRTFCGKPDGKRQAIIYLIGKSPLSEYLHAALQHCDPDKITLPHV